MMVSIIKSKPFHTVIALLFWGAVWYLAAFLIGSETFLPYPHTTFLAFFNLIKQTLFWKSIGNSFLTVIGGCITGCLLGIVLAALSASSTIGKSIVMPLITVLRATPVASFIILIFVIVRKVQIELFFVSFIIVVIMVIPILYTNLYTAFTSFDKKLDEVATVYRFGFWKRLRVIRYPQIKPYLFAGVSNALGFAWKAGVAAEVICSLPFTIGQNLADSKSNLEMDQLFAWTLTVVLLSLVFELLFKKLMASSLQKKGAVS